MSQYIKNNRYMIAVDDDTIILNVLINHLKRFLPSDVNLIAVDNPQSALDECTNIIEADAELVLIISDYLMYPMKGSDLLIQVSNIAPKCKKIMLTGQADVKAVAEVINNTGLFHFIEKPWYPKDLELTILEAIHAYDNERRLESQEAELRALNEDLQNQVAIRTAELNQKNLELMQGLEYAKLIQSAFVPSLDQLKPEIEKTYLYESPLKVISGDFHWVHRNENVAFLIQGDCTGHGLAGALLSVLVIDVAKTYILTHQDNLDVVSTTKEIIRGLQNKVTQEKAEILESIGVDFCVLKMDLTTKEIHYANFNSNIVVENNGEFEMISKSKGFFRMLNIEQDIPNGIIQCKGKKVILFSDGLVDIMGGENRKRLKWNGLKSWMEEPDLFEKGPEYLSEKIKQYCGQEEQIDDITLLSLQC